MGDIRDQCDYRALVGFASSGGGFHDIDRALIAAASITDSLVFRHEMHHDIALTETNYGVVQTIFRAAEPFCRAAPVARAIRDWSHELYVQSVEVHEIHATFLSVTELPATAIPDARVALTAKYRSFYDSIASIFDRVATSTFLQFVIGKTLCELCFSSALIDKLLAWNPDLPPHLDDDDSPNHRFRILAPLLGAGIGELVSQIITRFDSKVELRPFATFDIHSEDCWNQLTFKQAGVIDDWLLNVVRDWCYEMAERVVTCARPERWFQQRRAFAQHISRFLTQPLEVRSSGETGASAIEDVRELRAWRDGRTVTSNPHPAALGEPSVLSPRPLDVFVQVSSERASTVQGLAMLYSSVVLISEPPQADSWAKRPHRWRVFQETDDDSRQVFALEHEYVVRLWDWAVKVAATGARVFSNTRIVAGIWADRGYLDIDAMYEVTSAIGGNPEIASHVLWYMAGDFFSFYRKLVRAGGLEVCWTNPFKPVAELQHLSVIEAREIAAARTFSEIAHLFSNSAEVPLWYYFRSPSFPGGFIRSGVPYGDFMTVLGEDVVAGRVSVIQRAVMPEIWQWVAPVNQAIIASWPAF